MKHIFAVLAVAAMMAASAMPAFAQGNGPSACKNRQPGVTISTNAQDRGFRAGSTPATPKTWTPRSCHYWRAATQAIFVAPEGNSQDHLYVGLCSMSSSRY